MKEFADKGYEHASTNRIVKQAGIGKGMLFYYFNSKKDLYHYLISYSIQFLEVNYMNKIDLKETDFIERLKQATILKMKTFDEHPDVFYFLGTILLNENVVLPKELQKQYDNLQTLAYSLMYDNIDTSLFRTDVNVEKAFQLIRWSIDGYQHHLIQRLQGKKFTEIDFDPLWDEFFQYLDVLRIAFYEDNVD